MRNIMQIAIQDKHKRKSTAVVLPVRMGDEGVALESSFKHGVKNEVLRSLCQLVNTSELALEVSLPCTHLGMPHGCPWFSFQGRSPDHFCVQISASCLHVECMQWSMLLHTSLSAPCGLHNALPDDFVSG